MFCLTGCVNNRLWLGIFESAQLFEPPIACNEESGGIAMKRNQLVLFLVAFLFLTSEAAAQTGTTSLRGTVIDKTGGVIQGARVSLSDPVRSAERTRTTSAT